MWPKQECKKLSDLENEIYRVQYGVFLTKFGHKLLFLYLFSLIVCERFGKKQLLGRSALCIKVFQTKLHF